MKGVFNASVFMGRPLYPADITTTVSVYNAATDELVPTLWLDRDGSQELANPHPLAEDGVILFYADPGRYNIIVEKGMTLYREWPDVIISDSATSGTPGIQSVVAGTNVTVDDTDPLNPVVSATGGGSDRQTVTAVTSSSGVVEFDYALGDYFTISMSENITGASVSNPPVPGVGGTIAIRISQDSTPRTFAFPANWQFTASSPLTTIPTGSGDDALLIMTTFDGGAVWWATMDTHA